MAQTIKLKRSAVSGNTPSTSDLELGEIAINTYDGKVFIKKNDGSASVVEVGAADNTKLPLAGGTLTGALNFGDNVKAQFGAGNDLEIFSNGSTALLKAGNATSDIRIESDNRIVIADRGFNEAFAVFNDDSDVKLYHDGNQKLATTSGGVTVTGGMTADSLSVDSLSMNGTSIGSSGNMTLDVAGDIVLDAGGQNWFFDDDGTRVLSISQVSSDVYIGTEQNDKDLIFRGKDGASTITALTLDMSDAGSATFNSHVKLFDSKEARFGTGNDGTIHHDGNHFRLRSGTGNFNIQTDDFHITDSSNTTLRFRVDADGATDIRYNGSTKLATTSGGIQVTGDISNASGDLTLDVAGDIVLDADGADVILKDAGTEFGRFSRVTSDFVIKSATSDKDIIFKGVDGASTITALTLDMSAAGAATFNANVTAPNLLANTAAYIPIVYGGSSNLQLKSNTGEMFAQFVNNGAAELYHDNVKKFETTSTGVAVTGSLTTSANLTVSGNLEVTGTTTQTGSIITNSNFTGLSDANSANTTDFGFYGKYVESSTTKYAGVYYDASVDNTFKFFCDTQTAPTTTVNESATGYALANVQVAALTTTGNASIAGNIDIVGQISSFNSASSSYGAMNIRASEFIFKNAGATEKVRINNTGLGIGTTSPAQALHVVSAANQIRIEDSTNNKKYDLNVDGDKFMIDDMTAGVNRFTISGANVGIGTNSPASLLSIQGDGVVSRMDGTANTSRTLLFRNVGTAEGIVHTDGNMHLLQEDASRYMRFSTANTERMRIDANGSVFISSTSDSGSNRHFFQHDGFFRHVRSGQIVGVFDRLSTDGNIVHFRKDGADIGMIGSTSGSMYIEGNPATGKSGLTFYGSYIEPRDNGAGANNAIDLGETNTRFKDLYLAGTANVGGNLVVTGDLTINGTTTTINTATLNVEDKNITLNYGTGDTTSTADGAGITIQDAVDASNNATILWDATTDRFDFSHDIHLPDDRGVRFGADGDLTIFHDGSDSFIRDSGTGGLYIRASSFLSIQNAVGSETMIYAANDGAVQLKYDNSTKLTTTSSGVTVPNISVDDDIGHSGDSDTYISFDNNSQIFYSGGTRSIDLNPGSVVINEGGGDQDFRVEGVSSTHLLFTDAANARVGIGTSAPASLLNLSHATAPELRFSRTGTGQQWIQSIDSSGRLLFLEAASTGGTLYTRMVIDDTGEVGIGTGAPSSMLHVAGGSATIPTLSSSYPLTISNNGNSGLNIISSGTTNAGQINFGDSGDADAGRIRYDHNDNSMRFTTNATEYMRITSGGSVGIGVTNPSAQLHVKSTGNGEIEVERASGALINLQAQAAAGYVGTDSNHLFGLKANGAVRLKISTSGVISFNDAYNFPTADGSSGQALVTDGSGNVTFGAVSAGAATSMVDADGDTKIQVEESSDEDILRFDSGGEEVARMQYRNNEVFLDLRRRGVNAYGNLSFSGLGLNTNTPAGYNPLVVQVGGAEKFRVKANGNVGIGTSTPQHELVVASTGNTTLGLVGSGYDDAIAIRFGGGDLGNALGNGNSGAAIISQQYIVGGQALGDLRFQINTGDQLDTAMFISNAGKVGIGTTAPDTVFHVQDTTTDEIRMECTNNNTRAKFTAKSKDGSGNNVQMMMQSLGDGGRGELFTFTNHDLGFATNNAAPQMILKTSGNVGIGTTAPSRKLTVYDASAPYLALQNSSTGIAAGDGFQIQMAGLHGYVFNYESGDLYLGAGGATRITAKSDGKVGIGTTAPSEKLEVAGRTVTAGIKLSVETALYAQDATLSYYSSTNAVYLNGAGNNGWLRLNASGTQNDGIAINLFGSNAGNCITFKTNTAERMRITHTGNVGIGTTAPDSYYSTFDNLVIGSSGSNGITVVSGTTGAGTLSFADGTSGDTRYRGYVQYNHNGDKLALGVAAGDRVTIDSLANVGIGTTSPNAYSNQTTLTINGTTYGRIDLETGGIIRTSLFSQAANTTLSVGSGFFTIDCGGSERVRLDTSGNLIVGKTATTFATQGAVINHNGTIDATRSGDAPLYLNRLASDGNIIALYKDSVSIGSIGSNSAGGVPVLDIAAHPTSGIMRMLTSGSERMRILADGKVGIGVSAPDGQLHVKGSTNKTIKLDPTFSSGTYTTLAFARNGTDKWRIFHPSDDSYLSFYNDQAGAHQFSLKSDGNVGIGTTAPSRNLSVVSNSFYSLELQGSNAYNNLVDTGVVFSAKYNSSGAVTDIASIRGGRFSTADGNYAGVLKFFTRPNGGSDTERMRISYDGNIGINTTAPTQGLQISSKNLYMQAGNILMSQSTALFMNASNGALKHGFHSTGYGFEGMNVGIGTTAPGSLLHVKQANNTEIITESVGDYFPSTSIKRTGGSSKTNYHWEFQIGSTGNLNFKDRTNSYFPIILNSSGDLYFGNDTSGSNPTMFVDQSTARVGIGTTAPAANLHVKTTSNVSTDPIFRIEAPIYPSLEFYSTNSNSNNRNWKISSVYNSYGTLEILNSTSAGGAPTTTRLAINKDGNIGIGTTAPNKHLEISAAAGTTGSNAPTLRLTNSSNVDYTAGSPIGAIEYYHSEGSGLAFPGVGASIKAIAENTAGHQVGLTFSTARVDADAAERMRIDSSGNVGIGTTAPTQKLEIVESNNYKGIHIRGSVAPSLTFGRSGNTTQEWKVGISGVNGNNFAISTGTGSGEKLVVDTSGNVGIGTASPTNSTNYKTLDIRGTNGGQLLLGRSSQFDFFAFTSSSSTSIGTAVGQSLIFRTNSNGGNNERMRIDSSGLVAIGSTSAYTTGGAAQLTVAGILSFGASNSDMSYIRRQSTGNYAWQTYNSANTGSIQLQPYGGNVGIRTVNPVTKLQVDHAGIDTYAINTSATSAAQVDTFAAATLRTAKYTIQITNTTDSTYHVTEILLIHDGTTPAITEYATIFTGTAAEATFDADIVSGNVRLLATPASSDTMQFKVVRHSILV